MDTVLSKTFSLLRFPLIVMVVFIHIYGSTIMVNGNIVGECNATIYHLIGRVFSKNLFALAVPTFYFIAGYLFFLNQTLNKDRYFLQMKKRFKSLVIPYLFWNLWMIVFMLFYQYVGNKVGFYFRGKADSRLFDNRFFKMFLEYRVRVLSYLFSIIFLA